MATTMISAVAPNANRVAASKGSSERATSSPESAKYWSQYLRSVLKPLFDSVGGYSEADQEAQFKFLKEHVAPVLGPVPSEPHYAYNMPYIPSPVETSVNLTSLGKPKARIWTNLGKPLDHTHLQSGAPDRDRDALRYIARANGSDTRWMDCLMKALFPTPLQLDFMRVFKGPKWPFSLFCFDFDGAERTMRAYFPVVPMDDRDRTAIALAAARSLEPCGEKLKPGLDIVSEYLADNKYEAGLHMLGVDCLDPERARLKVYMDVNSNCWNAVKDVMTLGGRLTDETTLKSVEILRSIYHLMRDEPEGAHDDDWNKASVVSEVESFPGLQFSMEIVAGSAIPETKIYALLMQWTKTTEKAEENMHAILRKVGHDWGSSGKISAVRKAAIQGDTIRGLGAVTFSYSKKKGVYTSFYFDPPTDCDDMGQEEYHRALKIRA